MIFRSAKEVLTEIWQNRTRMLRIVWYDIKIENRSLYLGTFWKILSPLIQLGTFWFVFGIGIRGGAPIDGYPFLVWLVAGLVPWFFINRSITTGAMSISSKAGMVFKIKFPIATIPVGSIIHRLYDHIVMMGILIVIFLAHGIFPSIYWLNLLYYLLFLFVFLSALAMVVSVLVQLAKDFGKLITSLLQLVFFLTPIIWQIDNVPDWAQSVLFVNPVLYVVDGYRHALLFQISFFERPQLMVFFWGVTLVLLLIGCYLQRKYATRFVDWM